MWRNCAASVFWNFLWGWGRRFLRIRKSLRRWNWTLKPEPVSYTHLVSFAASHRLCSVTYGLSDKDTVTFSSREEGKVVVALQRSVYTIYGKVVDPMEIPCEIRGEYRDFTVLAYVTLLLLLDEIRLTESGSLLIDWTI